jgi:hypothetical protein
MRFLIGSGVECDLDQLVESRLLVQAQSGGGKTTLLRRILEQTHGHIQQIVIDPEGEFYTLRERFDYIVAGKGGDCAADPRSAKLLAQRLLELAVSAVCDLYELKAHDRIAFVRHFLEALVDAPRELRHPVLVVIDEAHIFCPEKGQAESAEAVIDICVRGRKRGLCPLLATRRLSKLHKDAAAELRNVLIGATGLDIDQVRAGDVLGFQKAERLALRDLKWREFYAYGPALSPGVVRVTVGETETQNPKVGHATAAAPQPTEKIRQLLAKVADLPAEAQAERKTVEDLKRDLASTRRDLTLARKQGGPPDETLIQRRVDAAIANADRANAAALREQEKSLTTVKRGIAEAVKFFEQGTGFLDKGIERLRVVQVNGGGRTHGVRFVEPKRETPPLEPKREPPAPREQREPSGDVTRPQQRILDAIATFESVGLEAPRKEPVAVLAGVSHKSSGYTNNLGALRTAGLVAYPTGGVVALTDAGRELANAPDAPPTLAELHERWLAILDRPKARILQAVIERYPDDIAKADLAEIVEQSAISSGYTNNLGRLRLLGLIDYPAGGRVVATGLLFPEGLT